MGYNKPILGEERTLRTHGEERAEQATGAVGDLIDRTFQMVRSARQEYGMARLRLGALLDLIQEHELWRGKSTSFAAYLDDLRLNRSACRSYMRVARKFMIELSVSEAILNQLAACNMGVLEKAASVVNQDNVEEVMYAVLALHQRDALAALEDFEPDAAERTGSDEVTRLFNKYMDLTDDRRIDFLNRLKPRKAAKSERSESAQAMAAEAS